jgi:hypothetical protein
MRATILLAAGIGLALGCGDNGTVSPGPPPVSDGARLAGQFERLADSVESGGYSPAADALRHAAEIVRLTGHATPVSVTIDGSVRNFLAVAEQIDFPYLQCEWPVDSGYVPPPPDSIPVPRPDSVFPPIDSAPSGGDGGGMPPQPPDTTIPPPVEPPGPPEPPICTVIGGYSMRTLIAWEPEDLKEVVRLVAHIGSGTVSPEVPDVMTGLPTGGRTDPGSTPPDSGSGSGGDPGGWPGFMGEYLVRDVGSWIAIEGNQSNDLEGVTGECTEHQATIDWADFTCEAIRLRFEFTMGVDPINYERLTGLPGGGGPEGRHTVAMRSTAVEGVRLSWEAWNPPTVPDGRPVSE